VVDVSDEVEDVAVVLVFVPVEVLEVVVVVDNEPHSQLVSHFSRNSHVGQKISVQSDEPGDSGPIVQSMSSSGKW
jgi:hypothetical protein